MQLIVCIHTIHAPERRREVGKTLSMGTLFILIIIVAAVVALFVAIGESKKTTPPPPPPRIKVSPPPDVVPSEPEKTTGGRIKKPNFPDPNTQSTSARHGDLSIFTYKTSSPFWVCPNCECENSLNLTHCRVCFWDRSVEVR